jgi:hypothetical protein
MMTNTHNLAEAIPPKGRLALGGGILVVGVVCPLFVPLVTTSALPTEWKAGLSGLLLLGIPELFMLVAVAVLGTPGFDYIKGRVFG